MLMAPKVDGQKIQINCCSNCLQNINMHCLISCWTTAAPAIPEKCRRHHTMYAMVLMKVKLISIQNTLTYFLCGPTL